MAYQKVDTDPIPHGESREDLPEEEAMPSPEQDGKNYGFVINNRTCIGCHACSTACKSENDVALGVYRTWVKYTEVGAFPQSRRQFQVTRCNHCSNPPCVRICPVTAMYQRDDGIVEFDSSVCIGCKACMQACPYDAIHIDPDSGTASKCHYCSHRVDIGLEPACVVVCPTHSIIAGDMNDPDSEISRVLAKEQVTVRKPSQGTVPNLYYIDGADTAMHPTATAREPETFLWADVQNIVGRSEKQALEESRSTWPVRSLSGARLRSPQVQGVPERGPIQMGRATMAEHMVQVAYNAQHQVPWHWPVPAYLVTKGISSGLFLVLAVAWLFGLAEFDGATAVVGGLVSLVFLGVTTLLLVLDLEKPERFLYILLRPQWKSWLTRGAVLLIGFSVVAGGWWVLETAAYFHWVDASWAALARPYALGFGGVFAFGAAVYTAFLFGQAEGRDLWQSGLLPIHLILQAAMMGGASLLVLNACMSLPQALYHLAWGVFVGTVLFDLFVTLVGEFGMSHASEWAAKAAHEISHGRYATLFWVGSIVVGHLLPLGLLVLGVPVAAAAAGLASVVGLYCYEHAYVMAPQELPNS